MQIMESENVAVVPLTNIGPDPDANELLTMLLNREALIVRRGYDKTKSVDGTAFVAQTTGSFAKATSQVVSQLGQNTAEGLFRVEVPLGSTLQDLVPAVGGGFRGMVRSGTSKISGHARLIPVTRVGATVAAGPLIASIGLALASDMLAQYQMNKKLDAINNAVQRLQDRKEKDDRAVVKTAHEQVEKVIGYLLDQASLPAIDSASHAFGRLRELANVRIEELDRWTDHVKIFAKQKHVYGPDLMKDLTGEEKSENQDFGYLVSQTYEALALKSKIIVLETIAAEMTNKNSSLPHVEKVLHKELSDTAERQQQLVDLVDELNILPIDSSRFPVQVAGKGMLNMRTGFAKMARALHSLPDALPILDRNDQVTLDLESNAHGIAICKPTDSPVAEEK